MNRIDRLFAILLLLQLKRRVTARDIAAEFAMSERTVYRDMKALSEMGIPIAAQAGEGYELLDTFTLPPIALTEGEGMALFIALQWLIRNSTGTMQQAAHTSLRKIEASLPAQVHDEVRLLARLIDHFPSHPPLDWEQPELRAVVAAIRERRVLHMRYQGYQQDDVTEREIEPTGLTFSEGAWYVDAFCRLRNDMRSFRGSRILWLAARDEQFVPRIMTPARQTAIDVRVRFEAAIRRHVQERQHYGYVETVSDVMLYRVHDLSEIRRWLLGFGADAEVLEPAALRDWLRDEAQRLIHLLT
ncbi:MAG: YafY family protein [Chloroflexota bacterium]|nr:YafY family protein [Chloroflexota bacterium]